jgi:hypothetical protein
MKISRNFTLVLFLGAIAAIFFGLILMCGNNKASRAPIANQPFFSFGSPQTAGSNKMIKEQLAMIQHFQDMQKRMPHMETPPYVPVASVDAPAGVPAMVVGLSEKLTSRVPFTAQYHIDVSSKYSTAGYTFQRDGSFKPRPKENAHTYEGFCALDGNKFMIKEDDAKDNFHHVYALKDNVSYEREKSEDRKASDVMKLFGASSSYTWGAPRFDLCDYPTFWVAPHLPNATNSRLLKLVGKYIITNEILDTIEDDYTIEIVDGVQRLSSIVQRRKFYESNPWHVEKKEVFSNFTKVGGAWLPRSISITTYHINMYMPKNAAPKSTQEIQNVTLASLQGVTKTQITISSIKLGKPSPKYFDWRNYAVNGETARNFNESGQHDEHFVINTKNPDLWAQANATQNKLGEYAKNQNLRKFTFTKPFMAQYEEVDSSQNRTSFFDMRKSFASASKVMTTFSFDGKILLVKREYYSNNRLTDSVYSLTDPKITVTLRLLNNRTSLSLNSNRDRNDHDLSMFMFLPYNFDWNSLEFSAPSNAASATISLPGIDGQCLVALDRGFPKVLEFGNANYISSRYSPVSDYRLIDNVWIPGRLGNDLKLVYFNPVMPPASDFDLLTVIKRNITEKNMQCDSFDLVGNTPAPNGIHKMTITDYRADQKEGLRYEWMRIIDLNGLPILQQICTGKARPFDRKHDYKSMTDEYLRTHPQAIIHQTSPNVHNRNQIR